MTDTINKFNYVEYILFSQHLSNSNYTNINIPLHEFERKLKLISRNKKCFEKRWTRYIHTDLVYEVYEGPPEIKTYRIVPVSVKDQIGQNENQPIIEAAYQKEKLPFFMFPSTRHMNDVVSIHSTLIRLHNHVYINFERQISKTSQIKNGSFFQKDHKIFVNCNKDEYADKDNINKIVEDAIKMLCC